MTGSFTPPRPGFYPSLDDEGDIPLTTEPVIMWGLVDYLVSEYHHAVLLASIAPRWRLLDRRSYQGRADDQVTAGGEP